MVSSRLFSKNLQLNTCLNIAILVRPTLMKSSLMKIIIKLKSSRVLVVPELKRMCDFATHLFTTQTLLS